MSTAHVEQLRAVAQRLEEAASLQTKEFADALDSLERVVLEISKAWSGSSLGHHANIYYHDLKSPPPGAHFSSEWGLMGSFAPGTSGEWEEYDFAEVKKAIQARAGSFDLESVIASSARASQVFRDEQSRFDSLMSSATVGLSDSYVDDLRDKARVMKVLSVGEAIRVQLPSGPLMSRDPVAASAGLKHAPHQEVLAEVIAARGPFVQCKELARLCHLASDHLSMASTEPQSRVVRVGTKVFIGHGRSAEWRKLKDFVQDRVLLEWDEFNRVPVAGVTNVDRLKSMLDDASIAFLIMTAEDEQADGAKRARENVVHEAGLFQGRLGFQRAIIMVEDACQSFSNIDGLGQLRFPKGRIEAVFEDVRSVLEREDLVAPPGAAS